MADSIVFKDEDWDSLLSRIKSGKCTPFLGAGACFGLLPTGKELAESLATAYNYPLEDRDDLMRVAQYVAIDRDAMRPKEHILEACFTKINYGEKVTPQIPHWMLAKLPLPIYITTNYDNFMFESLQRQPNKTPRREVCRWNKLVEQQLENEPSVFEDPNYQPSPERPVIFHLHGYDKIPESLVLTEDDYIDFLVSISSKPKSEDASKLKGALPPVIQRAIAGTSLLFIGYRLSDINFRVLFRGIMNQVDTGSRRQSFTLQFPRPDNELEAKYSEKYFGNMSIKVAWGNAQDFVVELGRRWEVFSHGK
jgi:hypothetical protein